MKHWLQANFAWLTRFLQRQEAGHNTHHFERCGLLVSGRHIYGMPTIVSYPGSERRVVIGSFCSFAPGVRIITGGAHPKEWVSLFPFRIRWNLDGAFHDGMPESRGDVVVGSDVWVGTDAMILSGVTIGHGAIVAARAVVTRDVEPYAIVVGSPAKRIAHRFPPEIVKRLLGIAWWNWDDARILEAVPLLSSAGIGAFLEKYDRASGNRNAEESAIDA